MVNDNGKHCLFPSIIVFRVTIGFSCLTMVAMVDAWLMTTHTTMSSCLWRKGLPLLQKHKCLVPGSFLSMWSTALRSSLEWCHGSYALLLRFPPFFAAGNNLRVANKVRTCPTENEGKETVHKLKRQPLNYARIEEISTLSRVPAINQSAKQSTASSDDLYQFNNWVFTNALSVVTTPLSR